MVIAYGCCVGSWDNVKQFVVPHVDELFITMRDQHSIAVAYNTIIDMVRAMQDIEALVLVHDDLEIIDDEFEVKIRAILAESDVALIGVAGGRGATTLAWWNFETVGHQLTDSGMLTFSELAGDVEVLEGSIMVLSRWAIDNLAFDERYGGFHGYDDIGYEAIARGKRVVVADIDTYHHTVLGWKTGERFTAWVAADQKFKEKWNK